MLSVITQDPQCWKVQRLQSVATFLPVSTQQQRIFHHRMKKPRLLPCRPLLLCPRSSVRVPIPKGSPTHSVVFRLIIRVNKLHMLKLRVVSKRKPKSSKKSGIRFPSFAVVRMLFAVVSICCLLATSYDSLCRFEAATLPRQQQRFAKKCFCIH